MCCRPAQTFYWYGPHLRKENLLRPTYIFTKIKLQIIANLYYKTDAHFGLYHGNLSPKVGEDQEKKGLLRKSVLISASITGICPRK